MKSNTARWIWIALASGVFASSCKDKDDHPTREPVYVRAGNPMAGVAEQNIDFPMGSPMGGYSNRCNYLGWSGKIDDRHSAYTVSFAQTVGIQSRSRAQALWLNNGDQDLVILKADVIYAFDGLLREVERRLEEATGRNLSGRVVLTSSHTHNAPGNYSDSYHFYLGGDRYNEEVYQRFAQSLTSTALAAWSDMQPASIGIGMETDWDPDDRIYSDRRGDNDTLQVWPDRPAGKHKDPLLWVLRVDTDEGDPLGLFYNFGMHGTGIGSDNPLVSTDSTGHIEYALAERFDSPVVVAHWQGSAGDASPRGHTEERGFARLETLGEYAADQIYDLWSQVPVDNNPLFLETVTHSIQEDLSKVRVTRNGDVDWEYRPYEEGYVPDEQIWDEDGQIISPLDEFNAQYGGAFCGYDDPLVSTGRIGSLSIPYMGCMRVDLVTAVITGVFGMEVGEIPLPLPSSEQAMTTATRLGPINIRLPDGTTVNDNAYIGFFPGEVTEMFTEQFKRRSLNELGLEHVFVVGYAQDHEGYLLIPEDWLQAGYEPNINIWGPLQGEHIMEGTLSMMRTHLLTNRLEPQDRDGEFPDTVYPVRDLPELPVDPTPSAGTPVTSVPTDFYNPIEGLDEVYTHPPRTVARVQGLAQFMWSGGDPAVDVPVVILERWEEDEWVEVTTEAGRTISDTLPDIITATTPFPPYPDEAPQEHIWWAGFQAVNHHFDRTALPLGWYRLAVYGRTLDTTLEDSSTTNTWPYETFSYALASDPFEVVPARIELSLSDSTLQAWIPGPAWGYRLIDMDGQSRGYNPIHNATIQWRLSDWSTLEEEVEGETISTQDTESSAEAPKGLTTFALDIPDDAIGFTLTDAHGNVGVHYFDSE